MASSQKMSRFTLLFLIFFLGAAITVSAEEGFFEGFGQFLDDIGDYVENIDFSSYIPDTSFESNKRSNNYFHIILFDNIFPFRTVNEPPTLADYLLGKSFLAVTCIGLSFIVIFIILDLINNRSLRGTRILNMFILWIGAMLGCFAIYILYHLIIFIGMIIVTLIPHFCRYYIIVSGLLLITYGVIRGYKKSGIRIVHRR